MPIPLIKLLTVTIRITCRPIVNQLKIVFQHRFRNTQSIFIKFGQYIHKKEVNLNRKFLSSEKTKALEIKPLSDEVAFQKGAEYFVEYVFFYGFLLGLSYYEIMKQMNTAKESKKTVDKLTKYCKENEKTLERIRNEISKNKLRIREEEKEYQQFKESVSRELSHLKSEYVLKLKQINTQLENLE